MATYLIISVIMATLITIISVSVAGPKAHKAIVENCNYNPIAISIAWSGGIIIGWFINALCWPFIVMLTLYRVVLTAIVLTALMLRSISIRIKG